MQRCAGDLHTSVIPLSLEAFALEVKSFERAIFTCCEEPLVILAKVHRYYIAIMPIESPLLIWISQIVHLDVPKSASSQVLFIRAQHELVDGVVSKLFALVALTVFDVPKFDLFVVTSSR